MYSKGYKSYKTELGAMATLSCPQFRMYLIAVFSYSDTKEKQDVLN